MKKFFLSVFVFFAIFSACSAKKNAPADSKSESRPQAESNQSETASNSLIKTYEFEKYKLIAFYPKEVQPGDAVFVRLCFETSDKKFAKSLFQEKKSLFEEGTLSFYIEENGKKGEKPLRKSDFYALSSQSDKKSSALTLLSGIPLSSWWNAGNYVAVAEFSAFGAEKQSVEIPIKMIPKEFVSETIPLNASNTAIKTDTSKARATQINRLNEILETRNPASVFFDAPFTPPTPATRRTSFFADRRVYAYSNGKSSTSLHFGIDYGVPTGSEVRACAGGKVVLAETRVSTGWSVCIEHLPGLYSLYYHMSELKVEVGQTVERGELIGLSGATGLATGPHLHWEMRLNMEAVSPDFFTGDFTHEGAAERLH